MGTLVLDPHVEKKVRAERAAAGADKWDEVWEGVYVMSPLPNIEHQILVGKLTTLFEIAVGWTGLGDVLPGVNVSDRDDDWTQNYRCPDVAVILQGGKAINRDTYCLGGPDFAVEVVSPDDRARDKIPFYARVGVRELLVIDRDPWVLELYRLQDGQLIPVGTSTAEKPDVLASAVVTLTFRLVPGAARPRIEVAHSDGEPRWMV